MADLIERQAAIDAVWKPRVIPGGEVFDALKRAQQNEIEALPSAQPEKQWIPCSERLPEEIEEVNVTWINHNPEPYYDFVKDKPFTASAVYYSGKWYWYTSTCADLLREYGKNPNQEIDDAIEITAWMPLPEPWRGEEK